jgi:hypothetical protein
MFARRRNYSRKECNGKNKCDGQFIDSWSMWRQDWGQRLTFFSEELPSHAVDRRRDSQYGGHTAAKLCVSNPIEPSFGASVKMRESIPHYALVWGNMFHLGKFDGSLLQPPAQRIGIVVGIGDNGGMIPYPACSLQIVLVR